MTMQLAADALNRVAAAAGNGWTWVRCKQGYVMHQGDIPFDITQHTLPCGISAYRNARLIGTTAAAAITWATTQPQTTSSAA